ncbi:NB-ARC domain-containing protein [Streptomyces sp. GLT-R25]
MIGGMAGVGKTALAVHWAHQVADGFPDGQLYVDLRGFHPSGTVMSPAEAIRSFLGALGVPAQRVPAGLDAQAALYRSLLARRRVLIVLDNARDTEHVRALLPGAPGCLVVVTSRHQLYGLVAAEGAYSLTLDVLGEDDALRFLSDRLGPEPDRAGRGRCPSHRGRVRGPAARAGRRERPCRDQPRIPAVGYRRGAGGERGQPPCLLRRGARR